MGEARIGEEDGDAIVAATGDETVAAPQVKLDGIGFGRARFLQGMALGAGGQAALANEGLRRHRQQYLYATGRHQRHQPFAPVTSNAAGDLAAYTVGELGLATQDDLNIINNRLNALSAFAMAGVPELSPGERFALIGAHSTARTGLP